MFRVHSVSQCPNLRQERPIVDIIGQNYRPMWLRCDSFSSTLSHYDLQWKKSIKPVIVVLLSCSAVV